MDNPLLVGIGAFAAFGLAAWIGSSVARRRGLDDDVHADFNQILAATLTLLGLLIGFTFSMAISRYDLRKTYEEAEANAIGTEFVRAGLLPAADGAKVRDLLRDYLDQRVLFYTVRDPQQLPPINARTSQLQAALAAAVLAPAVAQPTTTGALVVAGMNEVLNSQGYTQAAWWNRIPLVAWVMMALIAFCSNLMIGYRAKRPREERLLLLVLPLVFSISFFLIADIDSPRGGVILVNPQNLTNLADSLRSP